MLKDRVTEDESLDGLLASIESGSHEENVIRANTNDESRPWPHQPSSRISSLSTPVPVVLAKFSVCAM